MNLKNFGNKIMEQKKNKSNILNIQIALKLYLFSTKIKINEK